VDAIAELGLGVYLALLEGIMSASSHGEVSSM
jgi:hypothetical protein